VCASFQARIGAASSAKCRNSDGQRAAARGVDDRGHDQHREHRVHGQRVDQITESEQHERPHGAAFEEQQQGEQDERRGDVPGVENTLHRSRCRPSVGRRNSMKVSAITPARSDRNSRIASR
jgi:hypothetical protein